MAAKFKHGRAVLQLINRLFLVGLFLLLSSTAHAAGSLSGTVVDAADGTTPVHPVWIWLWDSVNNVPVEGSGVNNNPDGSYLMENIPPGSYKVFYDAYSSATGYADKLYDNISCDPCDFYENGDVLNVTDGLYQSDVQMERRPMLSGRVTDESGVPLEGVQVELFDGAGNYLIGANHTGSDGMWYENVPSPGDYYARTAAETTPGYLPEVWSNAQCNGCDVTELGVPIQVPTEDVPNINFNLNSVPPELIFVSGMELTESPLYILPPCCEPHKFTPGIPIQITPQVNYVGDGVLTFTLESGPLSMTIDAQTGTVEWTPDTLDEGQDFLVRVSVTDGIRISETAFEVAVIEGIRLNTTVTDTVISINEAGTLNGFSIDLPQDAIDPESGAPLTPSDISMSAVISEQAPPIPDGVARLSDFFFVTAAQSDQMMRVMFPIFDLPVGRFPADVELYVWSKGEMDGKVADWSPVGSLFSVDENLVTIELFGTGDLAFIGLPPLASEVVTAEQPEVAESKWVDTSSAFPGTCQLNKIPDFQGGLMDKNGASTCTVTSTPDWQVILMNYTGESSWSTLNAVQSFAAAMYAAHTKMTDLLYLGNGAAVPSSLNGIEVRLQKGKKPTSKECEISYGKVDKPADLYMFVNTFNYCKNQSFSVQTIHSTAAHEYFHIVQNQIGKQAQAPLVPIYKASEQLNDWITEGTATWFEDEVFDSENPFEIYLEQQSAGGQKQVPLLSDLTYWDDGNAPYQRFAFFKLLQTECTNFQLSSLFSIPDPSVTPHQYGNPTLQRFVEQIPNWNCQFDDLYGSRFSGGAESALRAYELIGYSQNNSEQLSEPSGIAIEVKTENIAGPDNGKSQLDAFTTFRQEPSLTSITLAPNSAKSAIVPTIAGTLPEGLELRLLVKFEPGIDNEPAAGGLNVYLSMPKAQTGQPTSWSIPSGKIVPIPYPLINRQAPLKILLTFVNAPNSLQKNGNNLKDVHFGWELIETETQTHEVSVSKVDNSEPALGLGAGQGLVTSVSEPTQENQIACGEGDNCKENFAEGSTVTLTAAPAGGYTFKEWAAPEACLGLTTADCEVTMDSNKVAKAVFEEAGEVYRGVANFTTVIGRHQDGDSWCTWTHTYQPEITVNFSNSYIQVPDDEPIAPNEVRFERIPLEYTVTGYFLGENWDFIYTEEQWVEQCTRFAGTAPDPFYVVPLIVDRVDGTFSGYAPEDTGGWGVEISGTTDGATANLDITITSFFNLNPDETESLIEANDVILPLVD